MEDVEAIVRKRCGGTRLMIGTEPQTLQTTPRACMRVAHRRSPSPLPHPLAFV